MTGGSVEIRKPLVTGTSGGPEPLNDHQMMWIYLLQGIGLGLAAVLRPGPFQAHLISQSLSNGWRRTLPAALAPLISDGPIIIVCLLVLRQVPAWMEQAL